MSRTVFFAPPNHEAFASGLGHALNAMTIHRNLLPHEIRHYLDAFADSKDAVLVIDTGMPVVGYSLAPARVFFLEGCPTDEAWRFQANARVRSEETWRYLQHRRPRTLRERFLRWWYGM